MSQVQQVEQVQFLKPFLSLKTSPTALNTATQFVNGQEQY
jgi:hypothetical protein